MELNISQNVSQYQHLSQHMQLSLSMLQMDNLELSDFLQELTLENPVVELEYQKQDKAAGLTDKLVWLKNESMGEKIENRSYNPDDYPEGGDNRFEYAEESLEENLALQLIENNLSPDLQKASLYIIRSLDGNGYLTTPLKEIAKQTGWSETLVRRAWETVKQLDPPGVGARNLKECILIQLERKGCLTEMIERVVNNHLVELSRGHFSHVAQQLGQSTEKIKEYYRLIKELNPKPCASLGHTHVRYIIPDLFVVKFKDHFDVILNDSNLPQIIVRQDYLKLLTETPDKKTERYISNKLKQANWVVETIQRRKKTILETGNILVQLQREFFEKGNRFLVPISLNHIAERLGVHPSTVSRIISGKYLQCSYGVFPLKYFFTQGVVMNADSEKAISSNSIKNIIREMVDREDRNKPLSDQYICELLEKQGISISRRTVAKYRKQAGISSAALRREEGSLAR